MIQLPTGTVTFLFTDIEGSTRLLQVLGDRFREVIDQHARILRAAIAEGGGTEIRTEGDSFFAAFPTAIGAIAAAAHAQRALAGHRWPEGRAVNVRMGMHTGEGQLGGDDYIGIDVHRAARIAGAGHGGQVLLSHATRVLAEHDLPSGVGLQALGRHRLKDIEHPEELHQLVIDGLPGDFPPIRTLDARLTNLPHERTSFIGREQEVTEVVHLLGESRLVTLTGPGGTGKTRLALKVATELLGRFPDGVFLADLSSITDPELLPSAIAEAVRAREQPGRGILDSVTDHLRDRELLLVLDNCEQVVAGAPRVGDLLDAAPGLRVLATSRVPLRLSGEAEYHVRPMNLPDPARLPDVEALGRYEAVRLLVERVRASAGDFRLTEANAQAVAEITARLDGLPLAIELAARRVRLLGPERLVARLDQRLPLLSGGVRDLPERQRTLRAAIEWSHELLEPREQRLFSRLAGFAGGWTLEAAEAVCGPGLTIEVIDGMEALVDNSLVLRRESPQEELRFLMLETIREYAAERLSRSGEEEEISRRHAEHFRDLAEEAEPHLTGEERTVWLGRMEMEHDNLRAALDWAERTGEPETGLRTAAAIWRFWMQRGHLSEGRARLERLLSMPGAKPRDAMRARALGALGGITYWQSDLQPTRAAYEEALGIAREVGDPQLLAAALRDYAYVPYVEQDFERAEAIVRESMAAAEEVGDPALIAEAWSSIGFLSMAQGNPADAVEPHRRAIELLRPQGATLQLAVYLSGLGVLTRLAGDRRTASAALREGLEIVVKARDILRISWVILGFAMLANDDGRHERAARLIGASARIGDDMGGEPPQAALVDQWFNPEREAREALGEEAYRRARAEGYAMDQEQAVAYALAEGDP